MAHRQGKRSVRSRSADRVRSAWRHRNAIGGRPAGIGRSAGSGDPHRSRPENQSRHSAHEDHVRTRNRRRGASHPHRGVLEAHDHARRQHHRRGGDRRRDLRSRRGTGRVLRAHRQRAARSGGGGASRGGPSRDPGCVPAGRTLRLRLSRVPFRSKRLRRHRDRALGHRRPRLRPAALPASGRTGPGAGSLRRLRLHGGPGRGSARRGDRTHHGRHRGRAGRGGRRRDVRVQGGPALRPVRGARDAGGARGGQPRTSTSRWTPTWASPMEAARRFLAGTADLRWPTSRSRWPGSG